MVVVYTCLIGGRDVLRVPRVVKSSVRYVCFSDQPRFCPPWEILPAYQPLVSAQRNSRIPKHLPHLFFPEAEYSLWLDGQLSCEIDPDMVFDWLARTDLALYQHPCRGHVWQEADFCLHYKYGDPDEVRAQVAGYRAGGMTPEKSALWSGGVIVRRHTPEVAAFNETLWQAYRAGSCRDQLSIPYAVWKTGIPVTTIGDDQHILGPPGHNEWFPFYRRGAETETPERRRLRELCQT